MLRITKLLLILLAINQRYQFVDSLRCYVCTAYNPACADPPDTEKLKDFLEPCNGECVVYNNPHTGILTRTCSWHLGMIDPQSGVKNINGVSYTFCSNSDGCNAGSPETAPPSTTTTSTTTTTINPLCTKKCESAGTLNSDCSCTCLQPYSGPICEIPNCTIQFEICKTGGVEDCNKEIVFKLFCPKLCHPLCKV